MILDSSFLVDVLRGHPAATRLMRELEEGSDPLRIPAVVAYELWEGADRSRWAADEQFLVEEALAAHGVLPLTLAHAKQAGTISSRLKDRGDPIADPDLLVAGTALAEGETLVTRNKRDFERVPGLRLRTY
jgi:tRNA(fMet)-specific endonuclease VapC